MYLCSSLLNFDLSWAGYLYVDTKSSTHDSALVQELNTLIKTKDKGSLLIL